MRRRAAVVAALLTVGLTAACTEDVPPPVATPTQSPTDEEPVRLQLGVYGYPDELTAWQAVVDNFNGLSDDSTVELVTYPDHEAVLADVVAGRAPDVFMTSRRDLGRLLDAGATRPVGQLLDDRGVDFGDGFSRDAVESFAVQDDLQCMAWSVSPMVMYYNTDLVDFEKMGRRGLDVPTTPERWSMAEFTAAARFATRKGRRIRGVHVQPTMQGLAPFVHSGGGRLFDDETEPTTTQFSSEETRAVLEEVLPVLRDPTLTLTDRQLERATPLQWFQRGRLAMIAGFRDLVPALRQHAQLDWDVISMPVLENTATVGEVTGLCMSKETEDVNEAADLLTYVVSDEAVDRITRTGFVVPANTSVAGSEVFLTEGRMPQHARVYLNAIRGMVLPPMLEETGDLAQVVNPLIDDLLNRPGILDLEAATERIDLASQTVLGPSESESSPGDGDAEGEDRQE